MGGLFMGGGSMARIRHRGRRRFRLRKRWDNRLEPARATRREQRSDENAHTAPATPMPFLPFVPSGRTCHPGPASSSPRLLLLLDSNSSCQARDRMDEWTPAAPPVVGSLRGTSPMFGALRPTPAPTGPRSGVCAPPPVMFSCHQFSHPHPASII